MSAYLPTPSFPRFPPQSADDAALAGVDENDPQSVARFMKHMGREFGEDAGPEFEQAIEEMEHCGEAVEDDSVTSDVPA
jgi:hypothetical protein